MNEGGLVKQGLLTIEFGDRHPNPHIKCFQEEPAEVAVEKLGRIGLRDACLYPSRTVLADAVDQSKYSGRPYDLALALGEGQLALRFFDLVVLEKYRNDPRFHYDCDDVGGRFSAKWEATGVRSAPAEGPDVHPGVWVRLQQGPRSMRSGLCSRPREAEPYTPADLASP